MGDVQYIYPYISLYFPFSCISYSLYHVTSIVPFLTSFLPKHFFPTSLCTFSLVPFSYLTWLILPSLYLTFPLSPYHHISFFLYISTYFAFTLSFSLFVSHYLFLPIRCLSFIQCTPLYFTFYCRLRYHLINLCIILIYLYLRRLSHDYCIRGWVNFFCKINVKFSHGKPHVKITLTTIYVVAIEW